MDTDTTIMAPAPFGTPEFWAEMDAIQAIPAGKRVTTGVARLDQRIPGWWWADTALPVGLTALDLSDPDSCVVGQLFGGRFAVGMHALDLADSRDDVRCGFATGRWNEYPTLTLLWRDLIAARRNAGHPARDNP